MAQSSQQQKIDSVCKLVQQYFNEKNDSKVYDLTGELFRKQLSPEAFKNVFDNNLLPLGNIIKADFEFLANGVARYKAEFSSLNLSLLLNEWADRQPKSSKKISEISEKKLRS